MNSGDPEPSSLWGKVGAFWGVLGITLLFGRAGFALFRYVPEMRGTHEAPVRLEWYHWVALAACLLLLGFTKGYLGFQRKFSPRAAARALYLKRNPTPVRVLFAPFFCLCFFHATRKRMIVSYALSATIVLLIIGVHHTPQPWHGIIDVGVLFGLAWGIVSVWAFAGKALFGDGYPVSPETPDMQ